MAKLPVLPILVGVGAYLYFRRGEKCREGFRWDAELGACVQIPSEPKPVKCPDGYTYDAATNACVATSGEVVPPECEEGFSWDAELGACVQIPAPPEPSCVISDLGKVLSGGRTLTVGCEGKAVKELQRALVHFFEVDLCKQYGISKFDDGKYGSSTEKAVKTFQNAAGLTRDGKVGKNTLASLKDYFDKGNHSYANAPAELDDDARVIRDFRDARAPVTGGVCGLY